MKRLILIALIIIGVFSLFIFNSTWLSFSKDESKLKVSDKTNEIIIESGAVNVIVEPTDQQYVEAQVSGKGDVRITQKERTVKIKYNKKWYESFFSFFDRSKLTITIPEDYGNDIKFDIGSGIVNFKDSSEMEFDKFLINIGSGKIDLGEVTANKGQIIVGSGIATIEQFNGDLDIDVSSGMLRLHNMNGKLVTDVSSGKVTIAVEQLADSIEAEVSSGMLTLDLPDDADFYLKGNVSSGIILNNFTLENNDTTKRTIEGSYGKGTHKIDLEVSSGIIEIE